MSKLRPSILPKKAACPCYESNPVVGPAAERGTLMDSAFREELIGGEQRHVLAGRLNADENAAVAWAVAIVRGMACGAEILAREDECMVTALGMTGTADCIVPARSILFDLKTGARRNYHEQMAAYALGMMTEHFQTEWTCHLLFCDLREIVSHCFTYDGAKTVVEEVVAAASDPLKEPRPCDYCGWCVASETCRARVAVVAQALPVAAPGFDFDAVLADPERLGAFLAACAVVDDFRERARKTAIGRLKDGGTVPGWRLVTRKGVEFVDYGTVGHHIGALGFGPVLAAYGNLSASKFRQLWAERMPEGKPFPEEAVKHAPASSYLKQTTKAN